MNNPITKYTNEITEAYDQILSGKYNKNIIENEEVRIVVYKCGIIIRIDVKEKQRGE